MNWLPKLLVIGICSELWYQGGGKRAWMRDWLIPGLLGAYIAITHPLTGFLTFGSCQIIRLGYGVPDATDKGSFIGRWLKVPWKIRSFVAFLRSSIGGSCAVFTTQHYLLYFGYVCSHTLSGFLEEKLSLPRKIGDRLAGLTYGLLVLLI